MSNDNDFPTPMSVDTLGLGKIFEEDAQRKQRKQREHEKTSVGEYIKRVAKDPAIAQNSPSRLLEAIEARGTEQVPERDQVMLRLSNIEPIRYKAFSKLFGLDIPLSQLVHMLKTGRYGLSTGKQLLLIIGPTGSAKSSFVKILAQILEEYTIRPVYMLSGCRLQEEPLNIIPRYLREHTAVRLENCKDCQDAIAKNVPTPKNHLHLGVSIKGDLCPQCRNTLKLPKSKNGKYLDDDGTLRWWEYPVETFNFSIKGTRGISSFEPADETTQDVRTLVGGEDVQKSAMRGIEDPEAYALCGELEKGNRGFVEGREIIKAKSEFLWAFISVAEEQEFKVQGSTMPHISIDAVIIGHTNLNEYKKFSSAQTNEALHDRMYVIHFPYPIRMKEA